MDYGDFQEDLDELTDDEFDQDDYFEQKRL